MSDLPALTSPLLDLEGVRHAFFTRQGGVSRGVYEGLNVGLGSNDDRDAVRENRRRAAAHFGRSERWLRTNYQVHSATVSVIEKDSDLDLAPRQADALVTVLPGVVCGALAADCAPVLMADPTARVVAAAHAGWRGALDGVTDSALAAMRDKGARVDRIVAAVGPCIGPSSYEVGLEFMERFVAADPAYATFFATGETAEKRMFDLPGFVLARLKAAGIETCEWVGRDTCADPELFSNRRAFKQGEDDYGRLLSAIMLVP